SLAPAGTRRGRPPFPTRRSSDLHVSPAGVRQRHAASRMSRNQRGLCLGSNVFSEMFIKTLVHDRRDAERPLAGVALEFARVIAAVGAQLPAHVQCCGAIWVPFDIATLESQALAATELAPGGEQHHDRPRLRDCLVESLDLLWGRHVVEL